MRPFLLLLASCAATRAVPLTVSANRQIFVPVVVNGQRLTFQLDTGASASVLTTATWKKLGLPHGASEQAAGAGGQFDSETVKVSDLQVGERELHDMQIAVMDLGTVPGIDGVLGQDVLAHYIADIDLPHHQLVLRDRTAKAWRTPDLIALPYTLAPGGLIRIAASLGGRPLTAIVDLGAGATVANLRAAPNGEAAATASGADGQALAMSSLADQHVAIGALAFAPAQIFVAPLPVFGQLDLADAPAMILGADLLGSHRVVIDPGTSTIYFSP